MRKLQRATAHKRKALNKKDFGELIKLAKTYSHYKQPCRAAAYRIVLDGATEKQQAETANWLLEEDARSSFWPQIRPEYGTPWGW